MGGCLNDAQGRGPKLLMIWSPTKECLLRMGRSEAFNVHGWLVVWSSTDEARLVNLPEGAERFMIHAAWMQPCLDDTADVTVGAHASATLARPVAAVGDGSAALPVTTVGVALCRPDGTQHTARGSANPRA